ncbi:hypothetical protein N657DRAFT_679643 [Parathielavia appendiculata]|uniref:Uncharacterized protein n=1 Tax=Parathielavia appendiculata TaxID=2587402 RepID=A0AAN6Z508_9PEZI|nr:hypothetical protein N657DRAFT_679643 [Parathielavia appendiculata]
MDDNKQNQIGAQASKHQNHHHGTGPVTKGRSGFQGSLPMPKAVLVYPFGRPLMRRQLGDTDVYTAVRMSLGVPHLTPGMLDTSSHAFLEEATKMLQENQNKQLPYNPLKFMKILRKRPALRESWLRRNSSFLLTVFVILRAARW